MKKKWSLVIVCCLITMLLVACDKDDTYKLAKNMNNYKLNGTGYQETLQMAKKGNYDPNCKDCFKGNDSSNISLFAFACSVDMDFAKAVYENGADIEASNDKMPRTPLLAALYQNRNNTEIVYWLIEEGANINAVDFDGKSVFHYLRYWEDNENTQELISYFLNNCDMEQIKKDTVGSKNPTWDEMWDEYGNLVFYN